eukprot:COSAG05_NODE_4956_length_1312_cov_1.389942_1_plen_44_part_00
MKVTVHSAEFAGLSKLKQHRLVQDALKMEIAELHGLNVDTKAL